jgi:hypothetical protein
MIEVSVVEIIKKEEKRINNSEAIKLRNQAPQSASNEI